MPGLDRSQIRFSQWQDPRLSVHPSRANPQIQQQSPATPTYAPWMLPYNPSSAVVDQEELSEEDTAAAKAARKQKRKEKRARKAGMCKYSQCHVLRCALIARCKVLRSSMMLSSAPQRSVATEVFQVRCERSNLPDKSS